MLFEPSNLSEQKARIAVVGVGGAGGNALNRMILSGLDKVEFIAVNTDAQDLDENNSQVKLQIGRELTKGLGAGANADVGCQAVEENRDVLVKALDGCDMVFITAGMGGGTGTGAAPAIAKITRELGALTVGVVTKPFEWEGHERSSLAEDGLKDFERNVDSLIVIPNDKLQTLGERITLFNAFQAANEVLLNSVQGIVELITVPGIINLDFADVKAVMGKKGRSIMGSAIASGPDRARLATENAINNPLLEDIDLDGVSGILLNVTVASDIEVSEFNQIGSIVKSHTKNKAKVIAGTSLSTELEKDSIRVTIVATGLDAKKSDETESNCKDRSFEDLDRPITSRNGLRHQTQDMFKGIDDGNKGTENEDKVLDLPAFLKKNPDLKKTDLEKKDLDS